MNNSSFCISLFQFSNSHSRTSWNSLNFHSFLPKLARIESSAWYRVMAGKSWIFANFRGNSVFPELNLKFYLFFHYINFAFIYQKRTKQFIILSSLPRLRNIFRCQGQFSQGNFNPILIQIWWPFVMYGFPNEVN